MNLAHHPQLWSLSLISLIIRLPLRQSLRPVFCWQLLTVACCWFLVGVLVGTSCHHMGNCLVEDPLQLSSVSLSRCSPELLHLRRHRYLFHLCRTLPSVAVTAVHGLKEAVRECHFQMKYNRWDCSHSATLVHDPPISKHGMRETALVVALSSAGVAWSVARSCSAGKLSPCSCDVTHHSSNQKWQWGGCSYNVKYGLVTSRRLLSRKRTPNQGLSHIVYKHNLKAGRMAVKRTLAENCKCHGVSGSCQMKTCWKATANLRSIGKHLKDAFNKAKLIIHTNSPNDSRFSIVQVQSSDLVYYEESPSFCQQHKPTNTQGTLGRVCSVRNDSGVIGDCGYLCCGRGFYTQRTTIMRNCNCRFVWCCRVECDTCAHIQYISKCL